MPDDSQTDTAQIGKALVLLVEQQGQRDALSGARKASMRLTLDEGHEMVVTATIHDQHRERIIMVIAVILGMIGAGMCLAAVFMAIGWWQ
jgi:hypothetical protein